MFAENIRIGDRWGEDGHVKAIHELCPVTPGPHVHLVTTDGPRCLPFRKTVDRKPMKVKRQRTNKA